MIDTICLLIPRNRILSLDDESKGFTWDLISRTNDYDKYVRNPTKLQKESGLYYPRLTGYKRKYRDERNIKIEFSIPKLLHNNNLDEVSEADFSTVIKLLRERLDDMNVKVSEKILATASVSSVHYSKNIILTAGYTVTQIISEINKIDLTKVFDFARARFINEGQSLYIHTSSHQFTMYDKLADMRKDKKRAIDKDQTVTQRTLFNNIEKRGILSEVIRFEVRLNKKVKLDSVFQKLGYKKNLNFEQVFKEELSTKVLLYYWNELIIGRNLAIFTIQTSDTDTLRMIYKFNPKIKPARAIYLSGLLSLSKSTNGMRELRSIFSKKSNARTWYRITKDLRELSNALPATLVRGWVKQIQTGLENYKPLKTKDYEPIK